MSGEISGDITIDVSSTPFEAGFKFNTVPFGGMTIDAGNSVRISSANLLILDTNGAKPNPPSEMHRGALWIEYGDRNSTTPDTIWICLKKPSANAYDWYVLKTAT